MCLFYFIKQGIRELYSSLVGGGNATFIGCQPPLNLVEEEARTGGRQGRFSTVNKEVKDAGSQPPINPTEYTF